MSSFDFRPQLPHKSFVNQEAIESVCALGQEVFDVARFEIKAFDGGEFYERAALGLEDFSEIGYHDFFDRAHRPSFGLIINDLSANVRTAIEPMVISGPRIRFYADMPIFDRGVLRGVVCIYDQLPGATPTKRVERQLMRFAQLCAPLLRPEAPVQPEAKQVFGVFRLNLLTREMWSSAPLLEILGVESETTLTIDEFLHFFCKTDAETLILAFWQSVSQGVDFDLHLPIHTETNETRSLILRGGLDKQSDASQLWLCAVVSPEGDAETRDANDWQEKVTQAVVEPLKTISAFTNRCHIEPKVSDLEESEAKAPDFNGIERLHNDLLRARHRLERLEAQMTQAEQRPSLVRQRDKTFLDYDYLQTNIDGLSYSSARP